MKKLFLFLSLDKDVLIGTLTSDYVRGEEVFSFEYDDEYLSSKNIVLFDPSLFSYKGVQYNFNFINDMVPDRFGSLLIDKLEQKIANDEGRLPKKLSTSDYLVRVNDLTRMGALRIKERIVGPFLNDSKEVIPPFAYLRDIEYASRQIEEDVDISDDTYRRLLLPGSSLGGARPKATVYLNDDVYLAKFPSKNDNYDVELWEYIVNQIAKEIGLDVPSSSIHKFSSHGHTLLLKRFDRNGQRRIHYLSAVTALETKDGESSRYSYLDLANFINSHCSDVKNNLHELYKRMVFTYLINNTDNHLRNHAFIYDKDKLILSPMFDINPSFSLGEYELAFGNGNNVSGIIDVSKYFYVNKEEAKTYFNKDSKIILNALDKYLAQYPSIKPQAELLKKIVNDRVEELNKLS